MKPWPNVLAERYPLPSNVLAERPWWQREVPFAFRRRDGVLVVAAPHVQNVEFYSVRPTTPMRCSALPGSILTLTADADTAAPFPFPGLRVGQTWAVNVSETDASVFTITEYDAEHVEVDGRLLPRSSHPRADVDPRVLVPRYNDPTISRPWHAGGAWITEAELLDLCRDGYLLADQVCPWLAPWAGPCPG